MRFVLSSLSKLYSDVQELLVSEPEFQHVGRLWRELNAMGTFMDTLRSRPEMASGLFRHLISLLQNFPVEANQSLVKL